jgi:long-chain fatty acid transport protein
MPTYYYESFRIIGFPAIVTNHITMGVGYDVTERFTLNIGYMHAFEASISESGTNLAGQPTGLEELSAEMLQRNRAEPQPRGSPGKNG